MQNQGSSTSVYVREVPKRTYYLGNVRVVIGDLKLNDGSGGFLPDEKQYTNYYPYGMPHPNRTWTAADGNYRYGFNGVEKEGEVYGKGNMSAMDFRMYDPRVGRWWGVDKIVKVHESPYAAFFNNPINYADPSGLQASPGPWAPPAEGPVTGYDPPTTPASTGGTGNTNSSNASGLGSVNTPGETAGDLDHANAVRKAYDESDYAKEQAYYDFANDMLAANYRFGDKYLPSSYLSKIGDKVLPESETSSRTVFIHKDRVDPHFQQAGCERCGDEWIEYDVGSDGILLGMHTNIWDRFFGGPQIDIGPVGITTVPTKAKGVIAVIKTAKTLVYNVKRLRSILRTYRTWYISCTTNLLVLRE